MKKFEANQLVETAEGEIGRYIKPFGENGEYSYIMVFLNEPDEEGYEREMYIRKTETLKPFEYEN